ncbi:MAG: bifunctional folylpolyglutamate synthase/dihydrofolate synthase, partial [Clostridiales bacterium]|nr:bifunctional folylpolyglutamate synthase/dihydrofolate synthase [Clostridiales bacterium]
MNADEAIDFIHEKFWRGSKLGLSRTNKLLSLMGNPQNKLDFIHIAGTNGKGSTSAMLSFIFREAGYKTGLFTSPYISSFNERMQVNG